MLNSKLVGVTAGLGTARDTPAGVVTSAIGSPARNPVRPACQVTRATSRSSAQLVVSQVLAAAGLAVFTFTGFAALWTASAAMASARSPLRDDVER